MVWMNSSMLRTSPCLGQLRRGLALPQKGSRQASSLGQLAKSSRTLPPRLPPGLWVRAIAWV